MAIDTSLISWYQFDDLNGTDSVTASGNDLTKNGTPVTQAGKLGTVVDLEASNNDFFSLADASAGDFEFGDTDWSVSLFVKAESLGTHGIIGKYNATGNQRSWLLYYLGGNFNVALSSDGAAADVINSSTLLTPATETWYHIVVTHDATADTFTLRINNSQPVSGAHSGGVFNSTEDFKIGSWAGSDWDGEVSQFGIWGKVLSPDEIGWLYNEGFGRTYSDLADGHTNDLTSNLVSYWQMQRPSGYALDSWGGNHLTDTNTCGTRAGRVGSGRDFIAANNERFILANASAGDFKFSGNEAFAFCAWINADALPNPCVILALSGSGGGNAGYSLQCQGTALKFLVRNSADTAWQIVTSSTALSTGNWYFIVAYHDPDGDVVALSVNGGAVDTAAATGGVNVPGATVDFVIGDDDANAGPWDGAIDEVICLDRIPTSDEISWLYNSGYGRSFKQVMHGDVGTTSDLDVDITDGLVGMWELEEVSGTRYDSTGRKNDLTDNNTVTQGDGIAGVSTKAADFERGNTEYLSLANANAGDMQVGDLDFSMVIWVNAESLVASAGRIAGIHDVSGGGNLSWWFGYLHSSTKFLYQVSHNGTSTANVSSDTFGTPSTATWYMIYVEHDASGNTIGISVNNGTKDTTAHTTGIYAGSTAFFGIGLLDGGDAQYWDGLIDQPMVFRRVLSAAEITWLYNDGSGRSYSEMITTVPVPASSGDPSHLWWING